MEHPGKEGFAVPCRKKRGLEVLEADGAGVLTIQMALDVQRPSEQAVGASKLLKKVVNKGENPPAISKGQRAGNIRDS